MIKKLVVSIFIVCLSFSIYAINDIDPVGGRSAGMGRSGVAMPGFWSIHRNQAGLAYLNKMTAGVYYENRFMANELASRTVGFAMPTQPGVFALSATQFGFDLYNENKFGLAYANKFGDKIAAGLQLDYIHTFLAEDYGDKGIVTFEAGLIAQLSDNLYFGTHVFNPVQARIAEYDNERMPANLRMGFTYFFGDKVILNVDAEKDVETEMVFKTGAEYHIIDPVYVRAGISTKPTLNTFGFGFEYKNLKFDFASSLHYVLGYSPQFSLIYSFN